MAADEIYQIKVTLAHIRPPVWRRLLVPADITLARLHAVLQAAFGWEDYHLHEFTIDGERYAEPDPEWNNNFSPARDERKTRLSAVVTAEKAAFDYIYDFGDGWEHRLLLEKKLPRDAGGSYPRCVAGRRNGPPEDCGGPWGYEEFLETITNPDHPDHEERLEWIGGEFDPEHFDREKVNETLAPA